MEFSPVQPLTNRISILRSDFEPIILCFAGLYARWIQPRLTVGPVQFSCVLQSADQNSGLAPLNFTPLW